jgi:hypothetical protein
LYSTLARKRWDRSMCRASRYFLAVAMTSAMSAEGMFIVFVRADSQEKRRTNATTENMRFIGSNENKISDGYRERTPIEVEVV